MATYYFMFSIVFFLCAVAQQCDYGCFDGGIECSIRHSGKTRVLYCLAAAVLIFVAGLRFNVGADYFSYTVDWAFARSVDGFWQRLATFDEPGWPFMCWLADKLGRSSYDAVFWAALISLGLCFITIYYNTYYLLFATALFALNNWTASLNGIRQFMAAAITFAGLRFVYEKKFWKYLVVVILAMAFHKTAIVMIMPYFFAHRAITMKNISFLLVGAVVFRVFVIDILVNHMVANATVSEVIPYFTNAVNPLRVLMSAVPFIFFLVMYRGNYREERDVFWMNFMLMNAVVMFATAKSTYFARFGMYTSPYVTLAVPELTKKLTRSNQKIIYVTTLTLYAIAWWYETSRSSALNHFQFIWSAR